MVRIIVGGKVVTEKQLSKIKPNTQEKHSNTTTKKQQKEVEDKRKKLMKTLGKLSRKKVVSRRTFKKSKTTLHLNNPEVPSILGDPNRFFKDEMEETRRSLFFT